jgi:hypothetical protein
VAALFRETLQDIAQSVTDSSRNNHNIQKTKTLCTGLLSDMSCTPLDYGMYFWVKNSKLIFIFKEESSNSCFIENICVCVCVALVLS